MSEAGEKPKAEVEDQSMEEILQSIRRIISEDDAAAVEEKEAIPTASTAELDDTPDFNVLELTEIISDSAEDSFSAGEDVLGDIDAALRIGAMASVDAEEEDSPITVADDFPTFEEPVALQKAVKAEKLEGLISSETAAATAALFNKIKHPEVPAYQPTTSLSLRSGTTVEDLVVEMMRPMLKDWLDANLPTLVERVIEREVKKISS